MQMSYKYSDVRFYRNLCDALVANQITYKAGIQIIEKRIKRNKHFASEYWSQPEESVAFVEFLSSIKELLLNDIDTGVLEQIYRDTVLQNGLENMKCKIVFFAQELFVWPGIEQLYKAAVADDRFDAKVVYVPFLHHNATVKDNNLQEYRKRGVPVVNYSDYNLSKENPEIAVFVKPYDNIPAQFTMREVEKIVDHTVFVPYGLEMTKDLIHYAFQEYTHYRAWKHLGYGSIVKELGTQYGYRNGENIAVWGHPRVDNYRKNATYPIPDEWKKKIAGRKVVLWCPHHTINPGPECVSTWLDYYLDVFKYFAEREDLFLLWRPHPLLFGAIVNNGYMSQNEMDAFLADVTERNNVLLDQSGDYRVAFSASDAIITDGTTFSLEYLLTGKPLMLTAHKLDQFYNYEELCKAVYWGKTSKDIENFLDKVLAGEDTLKEYRETFKNKTFFVPQDESISENILNQIIAEIDNEESMILYGGK